MMTLFKTSGSKRQAGFALPAVIFLIVIVALIIAAMQRINSNQIATSTMGLQSSRAYMTAYSGVEWVVYQVKTNATCPTVGTIAGLDIAGFQAEVVRCTEINHTEAGNTVTAFEIEVLATYGGQSQYGNSPDFASRELTVSLVIEN